MDALNDLNNPSSLPSLPNPLPLQPYQPATRHQNTENNQQQAINPANSQTEANQSVTSFTQEPADIRIAVPQVDGQERASQQVNVGNPINYGKEMSFLRRVCAVLGAITVGIYIFLQENNFEKLYPIAYCCLVYLALENLFMSYHADRGSNSDQESVYDAVEKLLMLYFLLSVHMQYYEKISLSPLLVCPCLFFLTTAVYLKQSSAPLSARRTKIILKLLYTLQVSLITVRVEGLISVNWIGVCLPTIIYLVSHLLYGFYVVGKALVQIGKQIRRRETNNSLFVKRVIKASWQILYYTMDFFAIQFLIRIFEIHPTSHNEEVINTLLKITGLHCSFFIGYTIVFFTLIKKFNICISGDAPDDNEELILNPHVKPEAGYCLQVQEKPVRSQFLKISCTFFIKVEESILETVKNNNKTIQEDLQSTQDNSTRKEEIEEEESMCYICELNQPDSILVDCGHGGICLDCAKKSITKKMNCMECRRPVHSIYHIDQDSEKNGFVKASEVMKVVHRGQCD